MRNKIKTTSLKNIIILPLPAIVLVGSNIGEKCVSIAVSQNNSHFDTAENSTHVFPFFFFFFLNRRVSIAQMDLIPISSCQSMETQLVRMFM